MSTADVGIEIVLESRSMNFRRFGFNVGGYLLSKRGTKRRFGA
jgi:hypothetical protein